MCRTEERPQGPAPIEEVQRPVFGHAGDASTAEVFIASPQGDLIAAFHGTPDIGYPGLERFGTATGGEQAQRIGHAALSHKAAEPVPWLRPQNFTMASPPMVNWELLVPQTAVVKGGGHADRKSTRLNSSHSSISYAVFCLKKKKKTITPTLLKKKKKKIKKQP